MSVPLENGDITSQLAALAPADLAVNAAKFAAHYEENESALARGATKTNILRAFAARGLSFSVNGFNKMLIQERERRSALAQPNEICSNQVPELSASMRVDGDE
jgi:hypothetical protein